jgi:hypothetical protein
MCPPSLWVKEKDILYTVQTFHESINHYSYSCVTPEYWLACNAMPLLLATSDHSARVLPARKHVKIEVSFFTLHFSQKKTLTVYISPVTKDCINKSGLQPAMRWPYCWP